MSAGNSLTAIAPDDVKDDDAEEEDTLLPVVPPLPGIDEGLPLVELPGRPPDLSGPFTIAPYDDRPTGWIGPTITRPGEVIGGDFFPVQDRYRTGLPAWNRFAYGQPRNPYRQNWLKGDYPILPGGDLFVELTGVSESFIQVRRKAVNPAGTDEDLQARQRFFVTSDLFKDDNSFTPSPWFVRITQAFDYRTQTDQGVSFDYAWQEAFLDLQVAVVSEFYDTIDWRLGRQLFVSDFRGFLYADVNDMSVVNGTWNANRWQWRVMVVDANQQDPISQFMRGFVDRDQIILGADVFRRDVPWLGFNLYGGLFYDRDTFKNTVDAGYVSLGAEGVVGTFEISASFIQAFGSDDANPFAGRDIAINAQFAALEVTRPTDWFVPRFSMLFASGDNDPTDGVGRGFDAIFDNPFFAGANVAFLNREQLNARGLRISNFNSFLPNLRTKAFDPANFVNPGIFVLTGGLDAVLTARTVAFVNGNWYWFDQTEALEHAVAVKNKGLKLAVDERIGADYTLGLTHKPLIIDNVLFTLGATVFVPGSGMVALTGESEAMYSLFSALTLVY